jgi:hypothetical protein
MYEIITDEARLQVSSSLTRGKVPIPGDLLPQYVGVDQKSAESVVQPPLLVYMDIEIHSISRQI